MASTLRQKNNTHMHTSTPTHQQTNKQTNEHKHTLQTAFANTVGINPKGRKPRGVAISENADGAKVFATAQFVELIYLGQGFGMPNVKGRRKPTLSQSISHQDSRVTIRKKNVAQNIQNASALGNLPAVRMCPCWCTKSIATKTQREPCIDTSELVSQESNESQPWTMHQARSLSHTPSCDASLWTCPKVNSHS